ncbi:MAG: hypothetical protein IIV11_00740, partial [Clostridia bacterium]|nr:hypothetical protein [Clostridia bacterium]
SAKIFKENTQEYASILKETDDFSAIFQKIRGYCRFFKNNRVFSKFFCKNILHFYSISVTIIAMDQGRGFFMFLDEPEPLHTIIFKGVFMWNESSRIKKHLEVF